MAAFSYMLDRVMRRLHQVFTKDPRLVNAISIQSNTDTTAIALKRGVLTLTLAGTQHTVPTIGTIQEVANAINMILAGAGIVTVQNGSGAFPAEYLHDDQQAGSTIVLYRPSSTLNAEMSTYARELDGQAQQIVNAEKELYANTADGPWLDYWLHDCYGIYRNSGETDAAYFQRASHEILDIKENNKALELLVRNAFGIDVIIDDAYPRRDEMIPGTEDTAIGRFILDMAIPNELSTEEATALVNNIKNTVRRNRAAGTDFMDAPLRKQQSPSENLASSETLITKIAYTRVESFKYRAQYIGQGIIGAPDFLIGSGAGAILVGAGWVIGTPGLVLGFNDATKEQIQIKKINYPAGTVAGQYLYGG